MCTIQVFKYLNYVTVCIQKYLYKTCKQYNTYTTYLTLDSRNISKIGFEKVGRRKPLGSIDNYITHLFYQCLIEPKHYFQLKTKQLESLDFKVDSTLVCMCGLVVVKRKYISIKGKIVYFIESKSASRHNEKTNVSHLAGIYPKVSASDYW